MLHYCSHFISCLSSNSSSASVAQWRAMLHTLESVAPPPQQQPVSPSRATKHESDAFRDSIALQQSMRESHARASVATDLLLTKLKQHAAYAVDHSAYRRQVAQQAKHEAEQRFLPPFAVQTQQSNNSSESPSKMLIKDLTQQASSTLASQQQ